MWQHLLRASNSSSHGLKDLHVCESFSGTELAGVQWVLWKRVCRVAAPDVQPAVALAMAYGTAL